MKKIISVIILFNLISLILNPGAVSAQSNTPTPKADVKQKLDAQINQLKDKIASRVSELNLVEKRGVIGTISEVKGNQLTLLDQAGNIRYVDVDEITKFTSTGSKSFGLSDLTKDTQISVLGIYNKQSKRLLARFIKTYVTPTLYSGAVTAIDSKNFQLTLITDQQKEIKVDVDTSTKLSSYTPDAGLARYGFSKIVVGDRVIVAGFADKANPALFAASRLIAYLGVPKDPNIDTTNTSPASAGAQATVAPTVNTRQTNPQR